MKKVENCYIQIGNPIQCEGYIIEQVDRDVVHLFWTGGWDSTFRLLQLLLLLEKKVQTYYIIDEDRLSTGIEIRTMKTIKEHLFEKYPKARSLMFPTVFKAVYDIRPNQEITRKYNKILEHCHIGTQYEWLARFCSETGIEGIELGCEKGQETGACETLRTLVVQSGTRNDSYYKLDERSKDTEYGLFKFFNYPLFNLTKIDMQNIARREGFEDFLELTWFCHKPRNNRPCGDCTPCVLAIKAGLGRRIPLSSRLRYYRSDRSRVMQLLTKCPPISKFILR